MFRFRLALLVGKCLALFSAQAAKLFKWKGTTFPGIIALRIDPFFLQHVAKPGLIIAVTGTNGKTTTTNFIADILDKCGYSVISNRLGANIDAGIATALMKGVTPKNSAKYQIAVLEVDERSSLKIYPFVQPDYLICTNLARDSFRRNAHPYYILDIIRRSIPEKTKLILNADDLISSSLGYQRDDRKEDQTVYFAIDRLPQDRTEEFNIVNDARSCPICQSRLVYDYVRYNQIGHAHCPHCGFSNPAAQIHATGIDLTKQELCISFSSGGKDEKVRYPLISDSIYNVYNELTAISVLREIGLENSRIIDALREIRVVRSRYYIEKKNEIKVESISTKGWIAPSVSAVFDYVVSQPGTKEVILMIEDYLDNKYSSENLHFIYDSDFEFLNRDDISQIIVIGTKTRDYEYRMLMAGIPKEKIVQLEDTSSLASVLRLEKGSTVDIIYGIYQAENYQKIYQTVMRTIERRAS